MSNHTQEEEFIIKVIKEEHYKIKATSYLSALNKVWDSPSNLLKEKRPYATLSEYDERYKKENI